MSADVHFARQDQQGLTVDIAVHPKAKRERLGPVHADRLKVAITAPPVDGQANQAVIALFAKTLGCAKRDVEIVRGTASRHKTIRIRGGLLSQLTKAIPL